MKFSGLILGALALLLSCPLFGQTSSEREFINKTYDPSVALMFNKDDDGYDFICTATAFQKVDDGYLFVSAAHCVSDGEPVYLGSDQEGNKPLPAEVIAFGDETKKYDFSVLKVKAPDGAYSVLPLGDSPTQKGEHILSISAPQGVGKAYLEGYISMPDIPTKQVVDKEGTDWQHNVLFDMLGAGPGSSGSTIVCQDQMKACAILIGEIPGGMVAEPIERFKQWWDGVQAGKIPRKAPQRKDSERSVIPIILLSILLS